MTKVCIVKAMVFPVVMYEWMWELDHKENWALENWCFQSVVLEKTLESPLDYKEIPVDPKGNQHWIFIGRTDAEAKTPILWPPDAKSWLIGKDPNDGNNEGERRRGRQRMRWHHWLNGHESEQTQGDGERQGSWTAWSSWGGKELDTT